MAQNLRSERSNRFLKTIISLKNEDDEDENSKKLNGVPSASSI